MGAVSRCPACGTTPRSGARFCDSCGTDLQPSRQVAEYKQVTVLFADVARSMGIAAAVGPERLREIMAELFDRSTTVVQSYGGTVDKFVGDGIMALFGAPVALEDHAFRACLAALGIQEAARALAADLAQRDGIELRVRVGLNSGEVIAGEFGSRAASYTVIGEQVGMAQRMESAAPLGGVMLSESTTRLVQHAARLGELEMVKIKGAAAPVPARQLLALTADRPSPPRRDTPLVGRRSEISALAETLDRAIAGQGSVMAVKGPPGIGKSRITREAAAIAALRGVEVVSTFCESHFSEIPFHAVAGLVQGLVGVGALTSEQARAKTRAALPDADAIDLVLLDDLLGVGDAEPTGDIDPDARRRRLTSLLSTALLARREPAVYIIEDAHWIDAVSESMLADFVAAAPHTHALVVITYRPEYRGVLQASDAMTISLSPLDDSQGMTLADELLGSDPSVVRLRAQIAERAAGNPFFAEEIVRDLAERNVLVGDRGAYVCYRDAPVTVPATVQATIAARIDRLGAAAKRTLHAASVIGSRFDADLLSIVSDAVALSELAEAELVERLTVTPRAEYAFRHPLMRAVAYEAQLKADRAQLHRAIAGAIEHREPEVVDKNASLIATHLEAAGDLPAAFGWHMRAGTWSTHRDIAGARMSWQRALEVADRLPADEPNRLSMQIAARTLLCATIWRVGGSLADVGFDKLRELADAAGDKRSIAMGMSGLIQMLNFHGHYSQASQLASEHAALLESIGDPELTVALMMVPILCKWNAGEMCEAMRLCQRVIDLSGGDATMGNLIIGSPLAFALSLRASAACSLGLSGWKQDFDAALSMSRDIDKFTYCGVVQFKYITILNWALLPDDDALRETTDALAIAEQFGDDFSLTNCEFTHGLVLVRREDANREFGFELLARAGRKALDHRHTLVAAWCADICVAEEKNRTGDCDSAIRLCRGVLENEIRSGEGINRGCSTSVLVESLLDRSHGGDLEDAQAAVDRLAAMPTDPGFLYHELPLLRLSALVAKARGDEAAFQDLRERYLSRAEASGFEGHVALARAMS